MRAIFHWNLGSRTIELGRRTLIMGIVNVTPDSFSDGGLHVDAEKAVAYAEQLLSEGATIIDVGGESTRPGVNVAPQGKSAGASAPASASLTNPVSEEEERRRVLPVIRDLKRRRPEAIISVDTYKASVARSAVEAGAEIGLPVSEEQAIKWLTINPAWALGLDDKIGSLEPGKNADVVLWTGDPFSVYSKPEKVWVDGALLYDRLDPSEQWRTDFELGFVPTNRN